MREIMLYKIFYYIFYRFVIVTFYIDFSFSYTLTDLGSQRVINLFLFFLFIHISLVRPLDLFVLWPSNRHWSRSSRYYLIGRLVHVKIGICPSRAISFSRMSRTLALTHAYRYRCQSTPVIIGMYNETNRSSTDMLLSASICQSLVYRLQMRKFRGTRDPRLDTTYYVFWLVVRMRVYM